MNAGPSTLWRGSRIVELRQYSFFAGCREPLIELFEREFVISQEDQGMRILGQFRSASRPDTFTWLRGFPSLEARPASLDAFYDGAVWLRHRVAANANIADSDDVLLLRPLAGDDRQPIDPRARRGGSQLLLTVQAISGIAVPDITGLIRASPPLLADEAVIAVFVSELAPNNWPRLPVREDGPFLVWLTEPLPPEAAAHVDEAMGRRLRSMAVAEPVVVDLVPTALTLKRTRGLSGAASGGQAG